MAEHGTYGMYTNYTCRCEPCREAARIQNRKYRSTPNGRVATRRGIDRYQNTAKGQLAMIAVQARLRGGQ
jgi:hypothetical protein